MARIAYVAHPVGGGEDRAKNLENVNEWFRLLFHGTDLALCVPWKIYVDNLSEEHVKRAMRDDLSILSRCDLILLCGGRISPGMLLEASTAKLLGLPVVDLTMYGYTATPEALRGLPDDLVVVR